MCTFAMIGALEDVVLNIMVLKLWIMLTGEKLTLLLLMIGGIRPLYDETLLYVLFFKVVNLLSINEKWIVCDLYDNK